MTSQECPIFKYTATYDVYPGTFNKLTGLMKPTHQMDYTFNSINEPADLRAREFAGNREFIRKHERKLNGVLGEGTRLSLVRLIRQHGDETVEIKIAA